MSSSSTLVSTRFYATDLLPLVMLITWMITFSAIFVLVVFYPLPTLASAYQGFVSRLVTSTPFDNLLLLVILCWFSSNFTIKLLEFKGLVGSHVVIIYTSKGLRLAFSAVSTGSTHEMLVLMLECYIGLLRSHYYFYKLVLLLLVIINWATFEFHLALMFIV